MGDVGKRRAHVPSLFFLSCSVVAEDSYRDGPIKKVPIEADQGPEKNNQLYGKHKHAGQEEERLCGTWVTLSWFLKWLHSVIQKPFA